jgi:hypothetical protein
MPHSQDVHVSFFDAKHNPVDAAAFPEMQFADFDADSTATAHRSGWVCSVSMLSSSRANQRSPAIAARCS